ncbi:MAG: hypothetical protein RLZZ107_1405 [Bacteroidota bacterium]|jgi:hypothetical protein
MKNIFAACIALFGLSAQAQVLEKPQLVEKIDTTIVVEEVIAAPVEVWGMPDIAESRSTPQFPGGQDSLDLYVKNAVEQFIYADTNETFPWGESVYVAFEVATDGKIVHPIIEMGYDALLDSAALEIVRNMPNWIPASDENGMPIVSNYRLQILFDLDLDMEGDFSFEEGSMSRKGHWAGFELGFQLNTSGFLDPTTTFATTPYWENNLSKSILFNLNTFQYKFNLISDVLGLTTGYGFNFGTTELTSSYVLAHNADTVFAVIDNNQVYKRNTLYSAYFTVPLLLELTAGQDQPYKNIFYVNAGVIGGVRMYSHQRFTGTYANGNDFDNKTKSKFNLNTWMLDATVRIGYGHFGLFANYAILSMFKEGTTAGVYPMRFGVSFNIPQ